jgi:DNA mismatch repair ATPase MutL
MIMHTKSQRFILMVWSAAIAASLTLGGYAFGAGQEPAALEQKIVAATTRADHESMAASYEQEAKTLQAKAEEHRQMAKAYGKIGFLKEKHNLVQHCDSLVKKYQDAAKENLALAKIHREIAVNAQ